MLDVTIRLNPYGVVEQGRSLARIRIANVTYDCPNLDRDCYVWRIQEPKSQFGEAIDDWGLITGYDRWQPVTNLLIRVMDDYWNETGQKAFTYLSPYFIQKIKDIWND